MGQRRRSAAGLVSVIVTMILMLVISLMVLGFSQVSRREQRENLDRKLSTQAFLAAETAINDATKSINAAVKANTTIQPKTNCDTSTADANYPYDPIIDAANNVKYTCLLVTPEPLQAKVDLAANGSSQVVNVEPAAPMDRIAFRWTNKANPTLPDLTANCPVAPSGNPNPPTITTLFSITSNNWTCPYGVIRIDIVPTPIGTTMTRAMLEAGQKTIFLYPWTDPTNTIFPTANYSTYPNFDGRIFGMACYTTQCRFDVSGLTGSRYMVRVSAFYVGGDMIVDPRLGGTSRPIRNSQIQIDATGRAQDVLRRVQVRLPVNSFQGGVPDYAIASASSICKRFESIGSTLDIPNSIAGQDGNNPMCVPYTSTATACVPTDIALVLDNSASLLAPWAPYASRKDKLEEIANRFVDEVGIGPNVYAGLVTFTSTGVVKQSLTNNITSLKNALASMTYTPGTLYQDALQLARDQILNGSRRRIMVFISDGQVDDGATGIAQDTAIADGMKTTNNISIYTVGIIGSADPTMRQLLVDMSGNGGSYADADVPTDFDTVLTNIINSIGCNGP